MKNYNGYGLKTASAVTRKLISLADYDTAEILQRFFKTGIGQYGEGDRFRGIRVPQLRKLLPEGGNLSLKEIETVLKSQWHEDRLFALLLLSEQYNKGSEIERYAVYDCYMENTRYINNWDLVDLSAPYIPGPYLFRRSRRILFKMAGEMSLWSRRIAIVATFYFIRKNDFQDTLQLAEMFLDDKEDLIRKATGWMLREIGKRDLKMLENFLKRNYSRMPRTMLRYAIEKFPEKRRLAYLHGEI